MVAHGVRRRSPELRIVEIRALGVNYIIRIICLIFERRLDSGRRVVRKCRPSDDERHRFRFSARRPALQGIEAAGHQFAGAP